VLAHCTQLKDRSCEALEVHRFVRPLDHRLTDGGHIVRFTRRFIPRTVPGTHFCCRLSKPLGHSAAGRIRLIKKCNDLIGNITRDPPACSIVLRYRVPHLGR
jgi:hypothetical protein